MRLIVACFVLCACASAASSQRPPPTPGKAADVPQRNASESKQQTSAPQRGTKDAPLFVEGVIATEHTQRQAARHAQEGDQKAATDERVARSGEATAIVAFLALGVAAVQVLFFKRQLKYMRDSIDMARDTTARELRATVLGASVSMVAPQVGSWNKIHVVFYNYGPTTARNVTYWIGTLAAKTIQIPAERPEESKIARVGVIAPHNGHTVMFDQTGVALDYEIANGRAKFFVFGELTYDDGFHPTPRRTSFCFSRTGPGWTGVGEFEICEDGNEAE